MNGETDGKRRDSESVGSDPKMVKTVGNTADNKISSDNPKNAASSVNTNCVNSTTPRLPANVPPEKHAVVSVATVLRELAAKRAKEKELAQMRAAASNKTFEDKEIQCERPSMITDCEKTEDEVMGNQSEIKLHEQLSNCTRNLNYTELKNTLLVEKVGVLEEENKQLHEQLRNIEELLKTEQMNVCELKTDIKLLLDSYRALVIRDDSASKCMGHGIFNAHKMISKLMLEKDHLQRKVNSLRNNLWHDRELMRKDRWNRLQYVAQIEMLLSPESRSQLLKVEMETNLKERLELAECLITHLVLQLEHMEIEKLLDSPNEVKLAQTHPIAARLSESNRILIMNNQHLSREVQELRRAYQKANICLTGAQVARDYFKNTAIELGLKATQDFESTAMISCDTPILNLMTNFSTYPCDRMALELTPKVAELIQSVRDAWSKKYCVSIYPTTTSFLFSAICPRCTSMISDECGLQYAGCKLYASDPERQEHSVNEMDNTSNYASSSESSHSADSDTICVDQSNHSTFSQSGSEDESPRILESRLFTAKFSEPFPKRDVCKKHVDKAEEEDARRNYSEANESITSRFRRKWRDYEGGGAEYRCTTDNLEVQAARDAVPEVLYEREDDSPSVSDNDMTVSINYKCPFDGDDRPIESLTSLQERYKEVIGATKDDVFDPTVLEYEIARNASKLDPNAEEFGVVEMSSAVPCIDSCWVDFNGAGLGNGTDTIQQFIEYVGDNTQIVHTDQMSQMVAFDPSADQPWLYQPSGQPQMTFAKEQLMCIGDSSSQNTVQHYQLYPVSAPISTTPQVVSYLPTQEQVVYEYSTNATVDAGQPNMLGTFVPFSSASPGFLPPHCSVQNATWQTINQNIPNYVQQQGLSCAPVVQQPHGEVRQNQRRRRDHTPDYIRHSLATIIDTQPHSHDPIDSDATFYNEPFVIENLSQELMSSPLQPAIFLSHSQQTSPEVELSTGVAINERNVL